MSDYGRRLVIDADFETAVGALCRALREEGLQTLARTDVREHFRKQVARDFRHYTLIQAWSPDLAFEAFRHDLEIGPLLPTTFAVYELADGEAVVATNEPMAPAADETSWRSKSEALAVLADTERERVARVLERLTTRRHLSAPVSTAA